MHRFFILLLLSGCASGELVPEIPSPSQKCHIIMDSICEQKARCPQSGDPRSPKERKIDCMAFMDGKVPFGFSHKGKPLDVRDQCDRVKYINSNYYECLYELKTSCEVPEVCDAIGGNYE